LKEVFVSSSKRKNNLREFVLNWAADRYAPAAIVSVSKLYHDDVEKFGGNNFELRFNSKKAVGVMLYGFATGQGIRDYRFDLESPVSNDFFYGGDNGGRNIAKEIQTSLYTKINALNIGLSQLKSGWKTSLPIAFSPDHTGSVYESFKKHINSNSIQFFTGGSTAYVTVLNNDVFISVYNESSRNSFFAHGKFGLSWAAKNTYRSAANSSGAPMSTITQTFETVLNLDASKIKKK
jgi:hypothetical protein